MLSGLQGVSYAINVVEGATLAISDSCFAQNDFVGDGAVILDREEDLLSSSGNFGAADDNGVVCQFISIGGKCREYESTSCKVDPFRDMGCFDDLNEVSARVAAKNGYQVETYTLCPNTVYKIGSAGSGSIFEDGFPPLTLRQNTRYICGSDGKSSNNCVLSGGQYQLLSMFSTFDYEIKSNIVLKGITFENGQTAGVLLVAPGDVIFDDCIFRVSHVCDLQVKGRD